MIVGYVAPLSGIMSEAELHILRGRMLAGARSKARRGELFNHAPIGYARVPGGGLMLDPDEQARDVVRLIFDKFDELGTVSSLLRYLVRNGIRLGVRPHFGPQKGGLAWRRPSRTTLTFLLHHPVYAGAYTRGRRPTDPRRKIPGRPATGRVVVPMDEWEVLIQGHLPGYITWDRYQANLRRLARNSARAGSMRAAREGESLLAGLVFCGRCGRRMMVAYTGKENRLRYSCQRAALDYAEPLCQSLAGGPLDELVGRQVLLALEPAALELSLRAVGDVQGERDRLDRQWRLRLERSRYEAERAARQYQACEPENRMVGRELERRWEQALLEQRGAEDEYDRFLSPGASKPATHGRFKTSHDSWGFRTRLLTLTGSTSCSKHQASAGFLFPPEASSVPPTVRPLPGRPALARTGSDSLLSGAPGAGGRFGWF